MKKIKKLIMAVATAALLVSLTAGSVLAAEEYTYTVRFSAGVQGTFNGTAGLEVSNADATVTAGTDEIIITGLKQDDVVTFNAQAGVSLDADSKYYVQGSRLSGRDNNTVAATSIVVDEDADYVVAYGIKGEMTSYTVNYYHEDGTELAPADTFYGNVGEKPVVAYKYIEDYVPQVYGYTKTLSANAAENVFTFIYEDAPTGEIIEVVVPGENDDDNQADDGQIGTDDGQTAGGEDDGNTPDDGQTPGDDEANQPGEEDTPGEGDQIVDLDEEVPQANVGGDDAAKAVPLVAGIAVAVIAVIAIIVIIMLVRKNLASRV